MDVKDILKKSEEAFEIARELIFLNKENNEKQAEVEKLKFKKNINKKEIKALEEKLLQQECKLEIASQVFLKEFNLEDKFMGKIETLILEKKWEKEVRNCLIS